MQFYFQLCCVLTCIFILGWHNGNIVKLLTFLYKLHQICKIIIFTGENSGNKMKALLVSGFVIVHCILKLLKKEIVKNSLQSYRILIKIRVNTI